MQDEQLEVVEEITEKVNVVDLIREEITEEFTQEVNVIDLIREEIGKIDIEPQQAVESKSPLTLILTLTALTIAVVALVFAMGKTDLTIGQGELYIEGGNVNRMLENLLQSDLKQKIDETGGFENVDIRAINIRVELNRRDTDYFGVSDISGSDRITAEIVFFPQSSVKEFAQDCRTVLDVMKKQDVVYDEIFFVGKNMFTDIRADLSGKFSMDITVDEIIGITFYFGEVQEEIA